MRYLLADFLASYVVWIAFVVVRRRVIEELPGIVLDGQQFVNAAIIAVYWLIVYGIAGLYNEPLRKDRGRRNLSRFFDIPLSGVLVIFPGFSR
ncbi:MAG: hypothetical protein R3B47_08915 [Bacteroidia bacterium]